LGNYGFPFFTGGTTMPAGQGRLSRRFLRRPAFWRREVVFFGTDESEIPIPDVKMRQNFARSMSLADAMNPNNLLCYEMNGTTLPAPNGFPLRLNAPGWYGIANVKWLKRCGAA